MRSFLIPAVIAGTILATPIAFAAQQATGTVKAIDLSAMTLTLSDGTTYHLPQGFKDPGIKMGEQVQVSWNMVNGQHNAAAVTIVK
jgi:Cu/Ag efflux protein CusF